MDGVTWVEFAVLLVPVAAVVALGVAFWQIFRE
jgi:Flp pilus assembly protein TadG